MSLLSLLGITTLSTLYVSMMMNDEIEQEERVMGYVG
jgi:hypothetical protein